MTMEEWKDIPGFDYQVSSKSRIRNKITGLILSFNHKKYYPSVTLIKNKERHHKTVHRIVAEAWIDNPYNKPQVNHKNGIKSDNRIENLEWVTVSENRRHALSTGLSVHLVGFRTHSKLDEWQVKTIKKCLSDGMYGRTLSKYFGIEESVISSIKIGRAWKSV